jgi:hypothetical protein
MELMDVTVRLSDSNMGLSASGEVQRGVLNELHKAVAPTSATAVDNRRASKDRSTAEARSILFPHPTLRRLQMSLQPV